MYVWVVVLGVKMAINKLDYEKVETCLFVHKIKPNVFLLRKVIGSKYFTKVLALDTRSGWSKRKYKNEAQKRACKVARKYK